MARNNAKKQISEVILKEIDRIEKTVSRDLGNKISNAVVQEMKDMISRGISPIEGKGRFQEYKGPSDLSKTADQLKKRSYPYSVQKKFPGKRNRPVNLFLSGNFLSYLLPFVTGKDGNIKMEIGFKDPLSVKKEQGHREGVNTQPSRPIIPKGNEHIAQRIQRVIQTIFNENISKFLKTRRR